MKERISLINKAAPAQLTNENLRIKNKINQTKNKEVKPFTK